MAERKFDYARVSNIYREMQTITGDSSSPDSIAGILNDVNKEVENKVEVMDEAVYGDLGKQLQLDWDNTSSSFNDFINNFNNWSTLIAQSAGKYAEFEEKVNGLKINNPLGMTSNGRTTAYTNTGYYADYTQDVYDYYSSLSGTMMNLTGAQYIDTNMVERENNRKIMAGVNFGLQGVSTVLSIIGGAGIVGSELKALGSAGTAATSAALPTASNPALPAASNPALPNTTLALPENSGANIASNAASKWAMLDEAGNVTAFGPGVTNVAGVADDVAAAAGKGIAGVADDVAAAAGKGVAGVTDDVASTASKTIEMTTTVDANGNIIASASKPSFGSRVTGAVKSAGNAVANSKVGQTVGNAASKVGSGVSKVTDKAATKLFNLTDETVAQIAKNGGTPTKYAAEVIKGNVSNAGTAIKNGAAAAGTAIKNGASAAGNAIGKGAANVGSKLAEAAGSHPEVVAFGGAAAGTADQILNNSFGY